MHNWTLLIRPTHSVGTGPVGINLGGGHGVIHCCMVWASVHAPLASKLWVASVVLPTLDPQWLHTGDYGGLAVVSCTKVNRT